MGQHGTLMASIIGAPRNGQGTVGVFPQARIVSVRVANRTQPDVYISPGAMRSGVRQCMVWALEHATRVASIVMAESNYEQRIVDLDRWQDAASWSAAGDALFVAAAGNEANTDVVAPIAVSGVLAVSAGDEAGKACSFVAALPQQGAIRGPGCAASGWLAGSSAATAVTGALAAALVTRDPSTTAPALREKVVAGAVPAPGSIGRLSGTNFRTMFAGLVPPIATPAPSTVPTAEAGKVSSANWRPQVGCRWRGGQLTIWRIGRTAGVLHARVRARSGWRVVSSRQQRFVVRGVRRTRVVVVWASSRVGGWRSLDGRCHVVGGSR